MNSRLRALAASLAVASLADARSQTSRTMDQSSDAVAVRYPRGTVVNIGYIGCRNGLANHTCQLGSALEIVFTPISVADAFGSVLVPVLLCPPPFPVSVSKYAIPELSLLFLLLYPDGLVVVLGWIWGVLCGGKFLVRFQCPEYAQGGNTACARRGLFPQCAVVGSLVAGHVLYGDRIGSDAEWGGGARRDGHDSWRDLRRACGRGRGDGCEGRRAGGDDRGYELLLERTGARNKDGVFSGSGREYFPVVLAGWSWDYAGKFAGLD